MSSLPKCLSNPGLRMINVRGGLNVVIEKLGDQHYLVWMEGHAVTEVRKQRGWSWSRCRTLQHVKTRREAILAGLLECRKNGPIKDWSDEARAALAAQPKADNEVEK